MSSHRCLNGVLLKRAGKEEVDEIEVLPVPLGFSLLHKYFDRLEKDFFLSALFSRFILYTYQPPTHRPNAYKLFI